MLQLHQNLYRPEAARAVELDPSSLTDGVTIHRLALDGIAVDLAGRLVRRNGTGLIIRLAAPLPPGGHLAMECAWTSTVPGGPAIRMGCYPDSTFFIGYWYPKIAMHDDLRGWDISSYDGEREFHQPFADYVVSIDVPQDFGVWCTGSLDNAAEVLSSEAHARWLRASSGDSVITVIDTTMLRSGTAYLGRDGRSTWRFSAAHVTDVAFGISPVHVWDAVGVEVEPGRRVRIDVARRPGAASFNTVAGEARESLQHFSRTLPAVPWPYPAAIVFQGDGGMEFPMIVNDGEFPDRATTVYVHAHELAHQYFPFFVGIDERRYGWFDEGMAYLLPVAVQRAQSGVDHRFRAARGYAQFAGREADLPLMMPSYASSGSDLQMLSYYKSSVAFEMLRNVIGEEMFTAALREFIRRWSGKHPVPFDFFHTVNDVTGRELAWFWKPWFFESGRPDLAIDDVRVKARTLSVQVRKVGSMPVPIVLTVTHGDGTASTHERSASVWENGAAVVRVDVPVTASVRMVTLGAPHIPDADPGNNERAM